MLHKTDLFLICFFWLTKKTVERSLTLCCSLSKICVFLFSSQRNDQRKVPKHLGEAQEVIYLFVWISQWLQSLHSPVRYEHVQTFTVKSRTAFWLNRAKCSLTLLMSSHQTPLYNCCSLNNLFLFFWKLLLFSGFLSDL